MLRSPNGLPGLKQGPALPQNAVAPNREVGLEFDWTEEDARFRRELQGAAAASLERRVRQP